VKFRQISPEKLFSGEISANFTGKVVLIMYTRIHARIVFIGVVCISGEISANFTGKIVLINQRIDLFAFEDYLQEITTFEFMKMWEISSSAIRLLFVPRYITHIFKLPIF